MRNGFLFVFALSFVLFVSLFPMAFARDFAIYNTSNTAQNYFIVNGTSGNFRRSLR